MEKDINKSPNIIDIQTIFNQIEELKVIINKKEDDLKNIINEKDNLIKNLNEKLLNQESRIKNNEKEIKKLNIQIEELKEKNEKEFNKINKTLLNKEEGKYTIKLNENDNNINNKLLKQEEEQKEIKYNKIKKKKIIGIYPGSFSSDRIRKEVNHINFLERECGFLSTIGIRFILTKNENEIEGLIKAPENSPYKNGIFNFVIKFHYEHPKVGPELIIKTKIFHTEVRQDGHCCIKFLNEWKENYNLYLIIIGLYEFFLSNNVHGYSNEATKIYREDLYLFEKKCQEYVIKYALKEFSEQFEYYYQDEEDFIEYNFSDHDFISLILNERGDCRQMEKIKVYEFLKNNFKDNGDKVIIAGNKIYLSLIDSKELLNNHMIIIAPKLY